MADSDNLTGQTPADTYTKLVQVNDENILMDGVGAEFSPIMKQGAVVTGSLDVKGPILKNGVEIGSSTDSYWSQDGTGDLLRQSGNVSVGTSNSTNPNAKLEVSSDSTTEDFFIIKQETTTGGSTTHEEMFKVTQDGVVGLRKNTSEPSIEEGGMYYNSTTKEFYLAEED